MFHPPFTNEYFTLPHNFYYCFFQSFTEVIWNFKDNRPLLSNFITVTLVCTLPVYFVQDGVNLVAIVAISDFTKDYLTKQKIIHDSI